MKPTVDRSMDDLRRAYDAFLTAAARAVGAIEARASLPPACPMKVRVVQDMVAEHFDLTRDHLFSRSRAHPLPLARHVAMVLCAEYVHLPDFQLARMFRRDHGMINHARTAIRDRCATDLAFAAEFSSLRQRVAGAVSKAAPTFRVA